jgi:glutamate 5-kinase
MTQRIVVKLGTSVLTDGTDRLHRPRMVDLARQIAQLRASGSEVVLVSSGAVLAGWERLGFPKRRREIAHKQALAAVGQGRLMHIYGQLFEIYDVPVAQALLTRADLRDRVRYLNARGTLLACLEAGVLPIINENDAVAVDEIRVGDNDTLSALVANLVDADLLIILSDIAGLYTADPRHAPEAELIARVPAVTEQIYALAGAAGSHRGTGGMRTKIQAAELATRAGTGMVITAGNTPDVLTRLLAGESIGTYFAPVSTRLESRKRWIMAEKTRHARIVIDAGAVAALLNQGRSLLPAGITEVVGEWRRGQTVPIVTAAGLEIACGLTQYAAHEVARIQGARSSDIEARLGYSYGNEVIHRDDMVMT